MTPGAFSLNFTKNLYWEIVLPIILLPGGIIPNLLVQEKLRVDDNTSTFRTHKELNRV